MPTDTHVHEWKKGIHLDACHSYATIYSCTCGATRRVWAERDIADDPWSAVWMADEDGEPCERCEALMNGAKPESGDDIATGPEVSEHDENCWIACPHETPPEGPRSHVAPGPETARPDLGVSGREGPPS